MVEKQPINLSGNTAPTVHNPPAENAQPFNTCGAHAVMFAAKSLRYFPPVRNEAASLAGRGWRVDIYAIAERGTDTAGIPLPGVEVHTLPLLTRKLPAGKGMLAKYLELSLRQMAAGLWKRADLFVAHDLDALPQTLTAARWHGAAVVYRAHELWTERTRVPARPLWRWIEASLLPHVDLVAAPTPARAEFLQQRYELPIMPLVVRNCPPFRTPVKGERLRQLLAAAGHRAEGRRLVIYQGTLAPWRCVLEMAAASAMLPDDVLVVLVGPIDRTIQKRLSEEVARAGDHIVLLPSLTAEEIWPVLCSADAGLALYRPDCLNNKLSAPNKVFEYMMAGLPIIGSKESSLEELILGEALGVLVNPQDPKEIAAGIQEALLPQAREKIAHRGITLAAERYNWEAQATPLMHAYERLAKSKVKST